MGEEPVVVGDPRRVDIRQLVAADIPELGALLSSSREFHRPWVSYPTTEEALADYVKQAGNEGSLLFVVVLRATGELVGLMNLSRFAYGAWQTCECGCAVGAAHRGRGYLTEAMDLLVRHAMGRLGMRRVEALVAEGNVASRRMLESVGFRAEGIARASVGFGTARLDQVRWAIVAADLARRESEEVKT